MSRNTGKAAGDAGEILASAAAERLGMTQQAIGTWTNRPGAPVRRKGTRVYVRWPEFARWREEELKKGAKKDADTAGFTQRMLAANARTAEINLARAEIELARAQSASIDITDVEVTIGKLLDRLMAMLRALPMRFPELGEHAQETIEAEVERMIESLHAFDEDLIEPDGPDDEADDDTLEDAA